MRKLQETWRGLGFLSIRWVSGLRARADPWGGNRLYRWTSWAGSEQDSRDSSLRFRKSIRHLFFCPSPLPCLCPALHSHAGVQTLLEMANVLYSQPSEDCSGPGGLYPATLLLLLVHGQWLNGAKRVQLLNLKVQQHSPSLPSYQDSWHYQDDLACFLLLKFIYLFIFGCAGSWLPHVGFL